jgi:hypothetical protein
MRRGHIWKDNIKRGQLNYSVYGIVSNAVIHVIRQELRLQRLCCCFPNYTRCIALNGRKITDPEFYAKGKVVRVLN